ncbi:MAG: hypothetical protein QW775_00370 [Ignisphaera sp.]
MSVNPAKVLEVKRVAKDVYYILVEPLYGIDDVQPFNFFMVWVPRVDEIPLSIAYFKNNFFAFLFKVKGLGTKTLSDIVLGQFIGLKGPLGRGFTVHDDSKNILVIAGGIGIAPIPLFIGMSRFKKLDVIWGAKSSDELFNLNELFPDISGRYSLIIATEDCSYGVCGTVLEALKTVDLDAYDVMVAVGPTLMLRKICEYLNSEKAYVALETMVKCGIGVCGSCYIKSSSKLLCRDGPVFKCDEVNEHLRAYSNS